MTAYIVSQIRIVSWRFQKRHKMVPQTAYCLHKWTNTSKRDVYTSNAGLRLLILEV